MTRSESIGALAAALAKAQGQMKGAVKDSANPYFKSNYADLSSVWEACRKPLADNNLAVIQTLSNEGQAVCVTTLLTHSSGEWVSDTASVVPAKHDAQGYGAVASYLRRYSLSAIIGGYADDMDAEPDRQAHETQQPIKPPQEKKPELPKLLTCEELLDKINSSQNSFELEARAKKYRPDFDALTKEEQQQVKEEKQLRKTFFETTASLKAAGMKEPI